MTTTDEQFVSDNSGFENQDNSKITQSSKNLNSEPETKTNEAVNKADDSQDFEIPSKFRNKDGSTNLSSLVKSYKELEPLVNEKANWVKERELLKGRLTEFQNQQLSKNPGFSTISANLYEKFLEKSTDIEKAKSLIEKLKVNPSEETVKELENLFPSDVLKNVYFQSMQLNSAVSQMQYQKMHDSEMKAAESYLNDVVKKNFEVLKNPVMADIFSETFQRFGAGLDSEWFFTKLQQLKDSIILEYQKEQSIKSEKDEALSNASKLSPKGNQGKGGSLLSRNALDLSPQELDRMLDEFYSK